MTLTAGCFVTNSQEHRVNGIVYWQSGAESRALYYQAFNIARLRLDTILKTNKAGGKPLAIVTDIDETLLDNSVYEVTQLRLGFAYTSQSWETWTKKAAAKATPGSLEFLQYAQSKNVQVLYITNRGVDEEEATLRNLLELGFPWADQEHFYPMVKNAGPSKESRRLEVAQKYEIILLIGDNLSDFSDIFEVTGIGPRAEAVDKAKDLFGKHFIILPNPMYGDWESLGVYATRKDLSESEKDVLRKRVLKGEP
ncbi:MAG: 5'-nucleotidase, lipoprotein e(P4) family [Nitrospirae bacterium]|nr:5'-nucleotidase, lipoprotein e(P4) family [Nitrospirota bacterium]